MTQIVAPVLVALAVLLIGGSVLLARRDRKEQIAARLNLDGGANVEKKPSPVIRVLGRFGAAISGGKTSRNLKEDLARAGFHSPNASAIFMGAKAGLVLLMLAMVLVFCRAFSLSVVATIFIGVFACGICLFIPNVLLEARRNSRRREVTRFLPDAVDLLEISISSGMGMDQAWNAVTDQIRGVSTHLADEMALTNLEMHLGASRSEAMRHMADRTGAKELGSLVACLAQAERFGTSMQMALRNFATTLRDARSNRAQEAAEKMAIKLIFPMIVLVFPPAVFVMAGPAMLKLLNAITRR